MKKYLLLLAISFGCKNQPVEKTFISSDVSISEKFYFISAENQVDRSRSMSVLCEGSDSVRVFHTIKTCGFDSADYLFLDRPMSIPNRIDSAVYFPDEKLDSCIYPICVQLKSNFKIISRKKLGLEEINRDRRLSDFKSTCEHMDHATLFELETIEGEKYSVYNVILYRMCDYLNHHLLLYRDSTLINHEQ